MLADRLKRLFADYDPAIQKIVLKVGELEQRHISMDRPRVKNQIDDIITRIARQQLERDETQGLELFENAVESDRRK